MNSDFIYGKINPADAGVSASGEEITPMYELEIRSAENKVVTSYSFTDNNIYTTDILVEDNLVTLNRVTKNGSVYNRSSSRTMMRETTVRSLWKHTALTGCRGRCALPLAKGSARRIRKS